MQPINHNITLTHKDIVRYFMTISEAANLVLESTLYSKGGDLFLLDMGEPVLIKDLASQNYKNWSYTFSPLLGRLRNPLLRITGLM